jgi:putative SOS response-associated peptidase YedK
VGDYLYTSDCKLNGPCGAGPLGAGDGVSEPNARTRIVVDENIDASSYELNHGLEQMRIANVRWGTLSFRVNEKGYPAERVVAHVRFERCHTKPSFPATGVADLQLVA